MRLSMSSYDYDPKVSRAEQEEQDADLRSKIEQIRVTHPRAGYRPLVHCFSRQGIKIGERRLRRVLSKFYLQIRPRKKFVVSTNSKHGYFIYPNLLEEMTLTGLNQVWTADITYIRKENGFVYLAIILDLYSRKIIGWQISKTIDGQ